MSTTTNQRPSSRTTCTLLLPQLVKIWLPEHRPTRHEPTDQNPSTSEHSPRSAAIPPLISFLDRLPDTAGPSEETKCKLLPCGHLVSLHSIISCSNFFGDAAWTSGPSYLGCASSDCTYAVDFPKIPDPRVLDGLQARLDLIQWSWTRNDEPADHDVHTVALLRDFLSAIGNVQDPDPVETVEDPDPDPRDDDSLSQTLVDLELEALRLQFQTQSEPTRIPTRGTQPYCSYRATPEEPDRAHYAMPSPGQECGCLLPHDYERSPRLWALTPAETTADEPAEEEGEKRPRKMVRFAAPVVTAVRFFEPWWCAEYRDSDRYWSRGPYRRSRDPSTVADDEDEVERLEDPVGWEKRVLEELRGEEGCGPVFGEEDGVWDGETLMGEGEEGVDKVVEIRESWADMF